jgi:hypothetical protein
VRKQVFVRHYAEKEGNMDEEEGFHSVNQSDCFQILLNIRMAREVFSH